MQPESGKVAEAENQSEWSQAKVRDGILDLGEKCIHLPGGGSKAGQPVPIDGLGPRASYCCPEKAARPPLPIVAFSGPGK